MKQIFIFIAIFFYACSSAPDLSEKTIRLAISSNPKGFDPAFATDVVTGKMCMLLYDTMLRYDNKTNLVPGIATHWEISDDGKIYTFHLRDDVHFTNGVKLTSADVKQSIERISSPKTNSPMIWIFERIDTIETPNEHTIKITIGEPFAPFIQFFAMPSAAIVPSETKNPDFAFHPVGSGPWILEKWEQDNFLRFKRNPNYHEGAAKMEFLEFRIITETMTQSAEFEVGNLDVFEIPETEFARWHNSKKWKNSIRYKDDLDVYYIGLNCEKPPLNNPQVRRALSLGLDRKKIVDMQLGGKVRLAHGPIPPGLMGYNPMMPADPYLPEQAKKLLKKAGFEDGFEITLWQSQSSRWNILAESIQAYWREIGVNCKIKKTDWNFFKDAIRQGQCDAYLLDWIADYPDAENFLFPLFHSSQTQKRNRYANPKVDALIEEIQREIDLRKRINLIRKVEEEIIADAPWIFLWHSRKYFLTSSAMDNYEPPMMFFAERWKNIDKRRAINGER